MSRLKNVIFRPASGTYNPLKFSYSHASYDSGFGDTAAAENNPAPQRAKVVIPDR
jgi:hypothetical protein